jgi:hypothetical protein
MFDSRVWCASALLLIAACSFPAYQVAEGSAGPSCRNHVQDGDETGTDCGGDCKACSQCSNDIRDGDEVGVDCGGSCAPCPTCEDKLQNGSESDVDCGGTCAQRCESSQRCRENADCASLICSVVCEPADCHDGVRNGRETGKDCGGSCVGCANGTACILNDDCDSRRCQANVCVAAGCTDGIVNGFETDEDCGGRECAPCAAPGKCKSQTDCESNVCTPADLCAEASCVDAVRNQGESDIDCGGPHCAPCRSGEGCSSNDDCGSGLCQNGTCVPQSPAGEPLNRSRWVVTTSESATEMGVEDTLDGSAATCWVSGATQRKGMWVQIDLGKPEIFFKALVLVTQTPHDQDFPGFMDVFVSNDGTFGAPSRSVMGNQWSWIDFQSAQVGRYVRFELTQPKDHFWSIGELTLYN